MVAFLPPPLPTPFLLIKEKKADVDGRTFHVQLHALGSELKDAVATLAVADAVAKLVCLPSCQWKDCYDGLERGNEKILMTGWEKIYYKVS